MDVRVSDPAETQGEELTSPLRGCRWSRQRAEEISQGQVGKSHFAVRSHIVVAASLVGYDAV